MAGTVLLEKDSLRWFPNVEEAPPVFAGTFVTVDTLCKSLDLGDNEEDRTSGRYRVTHYGPEAWGKAFGPLSLDQHFSFSHHLDCLIGKGTEVGVGCGPKAEDRANAAVLLGFYLILRMSWNEEEITKAMGPQDARLTFACSWLRNESERVLTVADCWAGIATASRLGWLTPNLIEDHDLAEKASVTYKAMAETFDAAWLAPGLVLICADPVTTVLDPNPNTFTKIFPDDEQITAPAPTATAPTAEAPTAEAPENGIGPKRVLASQKSIDSCDTVCKNYSDGEGIVRRPGEDPTSFLEFLHACDVGILVRTNSVEEPGMPGWIYDAAKMRDSGIAHSDIFIRDYGGGLPEPADVAKMLEFCEGCALPGAQAVGVHCKGGFGRSVTMACLLVMAHFDVPGRALLGWARIVRPGAVTTTRQERFIYRMQGRDDVYRYAKPNNTPCNGNCAIA
mmetsp:Transcript_26655/g.58578  ORF Transcript_26655/g.58578 Transcript_26655/m.58578 type:complete len:450 (-) Transcript_26655:180-1529(-)